MKLSDLKQETAAVYITGAIITSIAIWFVTQTVSQDEFDEHVASKQCKEATSEMLYWEQEERKNPKSELVQTNLNKARKIKEQQCSGKG